MEGQQQGSIWIVILFGVVFVGAVILIIVQKIKRKGAQWTGVVIDKSMTEDVRRGSVYDRNNGGGGDGINIRFGGGNTAVQRSYNLRIRDDGGKEFNWPVGEGMYQSVNVGDRLQKQPGTETPTVVSQMQPAEQIANHQVVAQQVMPSLTGQPAAPVNPPQQAQTAPEVQQQTASSDQQLPPSPPATMQ